MEQELKALAEEAEKALNQARDEEAVREVHVAYLGRKGRLTGLLARMKDVPAEDRPRIGQLSNQVSSPSSTTSRPRRNG